MVKKTLYFECEAGISADMALGALVALGADPATISREVFKAVGIPFELKAHRVSSHGFDGIDVEISVRGDLGGHSQVGGGSHAHSKNPAVDVKEDHGHGHGHMTYGTVRHLMEEAGLSQMASKYALDIFEFLGRAEADVHGSSLEDVAFHEVGSPASLIDIIGTAVAADLIGADRICCGVVCDGCGSIECAHGIIPVPVPAVVSMSKRSLIPISIDETVSTEMVTPSGYAILNGLGAEYVSRFDMKPLRIGYGFGKRDTGKSGALKAVLATSNS